MSSPDKYVFAIYQEFEEWDRVNLENVFLKSLRRQAESQTRIQLVTDSDWMKDLSAFWQVNVQQVPSLSFINKRMLYKVWSLLSFIGSLPEDSLVICSDVDVYFKGDPFQAFNQEFDIGLTTRGYEHPCPINAGMVYLRVNEQTIKFLSYMVAEIQHSTWRVYQEWRERFKRQGMDWYVDQDFYCCAWIHKEKFGAKIVDVGPRFNFCPHADGDSTETGKEEMKRAYREDNDIIVLHLKSKLKELAEEDLFDE